MSTVERKAPPAWIWIALITSILIAHALFYSHTLGWDAVDDAYISFRYAHNAARGYGLTFNPGQRRVEGYTNFLWTVIMIPAFWLRIPVTPYAIVLGLLCALGGLWGLYRIAQEFDPFDGKAWGLLAALLLAVDGSYALWATGGLETPLFAFLILMGSRAYWREMRDPTAIPVSGLWFALSAMTRPEGVLVFGLTCLHQVVTRLLQTRRPFTRQDGVRLGSFLLLWGGWFAFRWRYYGYPFPNSFYAKVTLEDTEAQYQRGLRYVSTYLRIHLGWPILIPALLPLFRRRNLLWASHAALLAGVYTFYIAYVGGDWSVGRFFAPLMPLFYLLVAAGLASIAGSLVHRLQQPRRRLVTPLLAAASILLSAGLGIASSRYGELELFIKPFNARLANEARTTLGRWLHDNVPPDTVIAVDAAGQIPFYSDLPTIDMFGINDLKIARMKVETMGEGTPGHEKFGIDEVLKRRPTYIIIYGTALDYLTNYRRVDLPWTDKPELKAFLSIYQLQE